MKTSILRRILLFCSLCCTLTVGRAQYVSIPDVAFGDWLSQNGYAACMTGSTAAGWQLDISCSDVTSATILTINNTTITDLTGVEYFTSLNDLDCRYNRITSLTSFPPNLVYLECENNQLSCWIIYLSH